MLSPTQPRIAVLLGAAALVLTVSKLGWTQQQEADAWQQAMQGPPGMLVSYEQPAEAPSPTPATPVRPEVPSGPVPAGVPQGESVPYYGGGCAGCGRGILAVAVEDPSAENYRHCWPGRKPCIDCEAKTPLGRVCCALHDCICCPDPCYMGQWISPANAAFFVPDARPKTHQRVRFASATHIIFPDRAEFFWAQQGSLGPGLNNAGTALGVSGETAVSYGELSMYTEAATEKAAFFTTITYRDYDPTYSKVGSGFADISLGTKSLLFDCELVQLTYQMITFIPSGNPLKGLGTGHVTLEPSLLLTLKLTPDMYLQGQIAESIPTSGTPAYKGSLLHTHWSLNTVLWRKQKDVPLIGTFEVNTWSFQSGAYTDPILGERPSSGYTYISMGPGVRMVICEKIDFVIGTAFATNEQHWAASFFRTEFRWRY